MKYLFNRICALGLLGAVIFLGAACKKSNSPAPAPRAVAGFWVGKLGYGNSTPNDGYAYLFRPDGTVRVYDDAEDTASGSAAEGTYVLKDSTVMTNYAYSAGGQAYTSVGVINSSSTEISGTWGVGASPTGGGMFILNKQQ